MRRKLFDPEDFPEDNCKNRFKIFFKFIAYLFYLPVNPMKKNNKADQKIPKKTRSYGWGMIIFRLFISLAVITIIFVLGIFLYFAKDLPSPGKISNRFVAESTKIYDRTGDHLLYEIHGEEKRTQIAFSDIPETVKYSTIALEDQEFFSHRGIKLSSIIRAALADILNRKTTQGGSTITQQFIKKAVLSDEKTFSRKIKEVILSIEVEQMFSKEEILGMYLNEIPYGSNAYGIEAAAQTFFGKHARELTLDEAALLSSLPNAPTYYSPYGSHREALKIRQESALQKMADLGYITPEQAEEAKQVDIFKKLSPGLQNISAPHFVMYIKEYLETKYGNKLLEQGGFKVYTTLDWEMQQIAERVVREGAETNLKKYKAENSALVAINPNNGQILAMVGSKDYFDKNIDGQVNVAIRDRQPGSSFKPYVYLTAFEKGFTPETIIWDVDTDFSTDSGKKYNPKNYDGKNRGPVKMKEALAMSLNVPAVKTLYLAGVQESIETAKKMGITTLTKPDLYGLSLVLGGGEVKLVDHVAAFGVFATGGIKQDKTAILKILDSKSNVLEQYKDDFGVRVVDEKYVAMIDYILSTNDLRAPVFGSNSPLNFSDRPVAAKTGTTNEWRDGWTIGYTRDLAAGVWTGNNDNSVMAEGADGVYVAAPIWRKFMDEVLVNEQPKKFPKYEKVETGKAILDGKVDFLEEVEVCKIKKDKYCLANDNCPDGEKEKKKFFSGHTILYYIDKNDPLGEGPKKPEKDSQFKNWEKAVIEWAEDSDKYDKLIIPDEECDKDDF
jgi:1A family penicillin-binding protein